MLTTACPDENQLAQLAEGALPDDQRVEIERHLDSCASCGGLMATLAGLAVPQASDERYRALRQLGAGAMGVVWEAEDVRLKRKVALKRIAPDVSADRERKLRMMREGRALAQLRHPNVLAVHDVGEHNGEMFLALELVEGTTARAWHAAEARTSEQALGVWRQVGLGLAAVHRAGIVHRDVKPDNVFVADDGRVLLGDFGLATVQNVGTVTGLTVTGALVGTPLYMAPEQLHGDPATAKSDQYALCVCIWEALAGTRPFKASSLVGLAVAMSKPLTIPDRVDRTLFEVLLRGLSEDPAKRWPDIDALLAALERPRKARSNRALISGAAIAAASAGVLVAWQLWPTSPTSATTSASATTIAALPADAGEPPQPIAVLGDASIERGPVGSVDAAPELTPIAIPPAAPTPAIPPPSSQKAPAQKAATQIAIKPLEVQPEPPKQRPPKLDGWLEQHLRAMKFQDNYDGANCLKALVDIPPIPADKLRDVQYTQIACTMLTGRCTEGIALAESMGRFADMGPATKAKRIDELDTRNCPLGAPPASKWAARALDQLSTISDNPYRHARCKPILEFIAKHQLQIDPVKLKFRKAECAVHDAALDKKCDEAELAHRKLKELEHGKPITPEQRLELEPDWDRSFHHLYRDHCPKK